MNIEVIVALCRRTLEEALIISAPALIVGIVVSLAISVAQTMTSIQEVTISTVPRLAAVAFALLLTMPWMLRHLAAFMLHLFGDFHPFLK
jgi:flagellar biosynthetic protein FliQ